MILRYNNKYPVIDNSVFICDGAFVIGDVVLEKNVKGILIAVKENF